MDPKSHQFLFTGINNSTKGYRYYNPATRQIQTSRNVVFIVENPPDHGNSEDITVTHPTLLEGEGERDQSIPGDKDQSLKLATTDQITMTTPSEIPIRSKSSRIASQNSRPNYVKMNNPAAQNTTNIAVDFAFLGEGLNDEPQTLGEAKAQMDWPKWKQAMDDEIEQLQKLGTYTSTKLPADRKAIACKWVYRLKKDSEGNIVRYKARLVAKGFSQIPGIDFDETFAPVMRLDTLQLLLALSISLKLKVHVVDVVGAYLNAHLKETIYMQQIPGYEDGTDNVLQLLRTLYGLKQSGRAWNEKLNKAFLKLGYTRLMSDQCVYIRRQDQNLSIVAVHVDDMTIFASNDDIMSEIKKELADIFTITDLGELKQVVGFEVTKDPQGEYINISQKQYIKKILKRFGMEDSKPCKMPMDPNIRLTKTPEDVSHHIPEYGAAIGSLMYAAIGTRPDIAYSVQSLSQFTNRPGPEHWTAVKRVFRYLNGTQDLGITYKKMLKINLDGYTDADWGSNPVDRKSISGYTFLIGDGPITWTSKKQQTVALSSMEAEYMAASLATREAIWLRTLLKELGFELEGPTTLNTDNQSAIQFAKNSGFHARSKHIDIQYHFVREKIISNEITIPYCASEDNLADIFTKALPMPKHQDLANRLGIQPKLRGSVERND